MSANFERDAGVYMLGDFDEAGRLYRFEAGQRSEAKPDTVPT
jgi:hypothetical protein